MLPNENTIYFIEIGCVTLGVLLLIPYQVRVDVTGAARLGRAGSVGWLCWDPAAGSCPSPG